MSSCDRRLPLTTTLILIFILFLSTLGDEVALVAFIFKVESASSSGFSISMLLAAQLIPGILLGPISGQLIDRLETTRVLVIALILQGLLLCLLSTTDNIGLLLTGAAVLGSLFAVSGPALFALLPIIVESSKSPLVTPARANTVMECIRGSGSLVGPVLGGILVAQSSTSTALLLDAATFLIAAPVIWFSGIRRRSLEEGKSEKFFDGAMAGIRILWQDSVLRVVLPVLTVIVFTTSLSDVAFIFFVRDPLKGGSIAYGVLVAVWGGGLICGALAGGTPFFERRLELSALAGAATIGVSMLLSGIFPILAVVAAVFVVGGMANGLHNVAVTTLLHKRVSEDLHGRVFAAYGALTDVAIMGGYLAASPFAAESSRTVYLVSGALATGAGILGAAVLATNSKNILIPARFANRKLK
ncbi:MFS transporter [Limnofasciculus baicalensis]|uniref:MFS transporter n=1 Tax=Limnofasciculus baicalensis BBK-W-15 TaxID=2699891 RepID=A0AAE3KLY6_9CYAN|nr:MFS transporter [Limnofasciculus baicalensis]MCP2728176.1 MFS transporter [Limnofasciculus baicalensis BBK-W-15]